jgi:hypothetical protein
LKILRHNFSHRITPVSLFCCRLLDHPCPAFAVTSASAVYVSPASAHGAPSTVRDDDEKILKRNFNRITNGNTSNSFGQKSETPEDGL